MPLDATLSIAAGGAGRQVQLADYLDADAEERAARQANEWIKSLRHARVDGVRFRERFTYRGDSLWWFAELYLHKEQTVLSLFRAINAAVALFDREGPDAARLESGSAEAALVLPQVARARAIAWGGPVTAPTVRMRLARMDTRSTALMLAAVASPGRPMRARRAGPVAVASFVHRAFWRSDAGEGSPESYIGPVLEALERRVPPGALAHVGVGPATNFRARRWWRRRRSRGRGLRSIERLVPRAALAGSSGVWAARHAMRRALTASRDLRAAAVIGGCDCWPMIEDALAGIALLQFPWSARAMDEAGAALDALQPGVALTYAEAGGWGRALALEARRRNVPLAGLQHGFIYRHWLNYLHEPDEMRPLAPDSTDAGFPHPDLTLAFDKYAADHLVQAGHLPAESIAVTGSPRLDAVAATFASLTPADVEAARAESGATGRRPLVLLVTKYSEIRQILPALLDALAEVPDAQLAIKTHPAETPHPYVAAAGTRPNVRVLPAATPLAPLLRASRAVVTVNSTVALDAMALGVPALSIGLPNNLSPFVAAGALAGASRAHEIGPVLRRLLYDDVFRQQLSAASAALAAEYQMVPAGGAAERQATAVLGLASRAG